jgi:hypothetical protein
MSILSSTNTGKASFEKKKEELQEKIRDWLKEQGINNKNYKIVESEDSKLADPKFTIKVKPCSLQRGIITRLYNF